MLVIPAFAEDIGNKVSAREFPHSQEVLPKHEGTSDYIISGSVEKNIDLTLENCIELALGNKFSFSRYIGIRFKNKAGLVKLFPADWLANRLYKNKTTSIV